MAANQQTGLEEKEEEDMSRYAIRKLSWSEQIRNGEVRENMMNATAQIFSQINESLAQSYEQLHKEAEELLLTLPSGPDIIDCRKDVGDNARKILKPSIDYLTKMNNVKMIRLVNRLQNEVIYCDIV